MVVSEELPASIFDVVLGKYELEMCKTWGFIVSHCLVEYPLSFPGYYEPFAILEASILEYIYIYIYIPTAEDLCIQ